MENNYNETDAAIFIHRYISAQMQQKYTVEQIEYLLELVYEYYETADDDENSIGVNIMKMTSYINQNINATVCSPIKYREAIMILDADNAYMESIGILEEENSDDDDNVHIEDVSNGVYSLLPQNVRNRYDIDDIVTVLCIEYNYIVNTLDNEDIDEDEMCEYIQQNAADSGIEISIDDIQDILNAELSFLYDNDNTDDNC
ncbi:MAG: hypothetical protein LBJ63_08845 [Prevotellaceae bacterium]|jgi:hypothetical protein|nr:hypothetical protein [Prevotellaceae bacterium]